MSQVTLAEIINGYSSSCLQPKPVSWSGWKATQTHLRGSEPEVIFPTSACLFVNSAKMLLIVFPHTHSPQITSWDLIVMSPLNSLRIQVNLLVHCFVAVSVLLFLPSDTFAGRVW